MPVQLTVRLEVDAARLRDRAPRAFVDRRIQLQGDVATAGAGALQAAPGAAAYWLVDVAGIAHAVAAVGDLSK